MRYYFNVLAIIVCASFSLPLKGQFQSAYLNLSQMSLMPSHQGRLNAALGFSIPSQDFSAYAAYNLFSNLSLSGQAMIGGNRSKQFVGGISYFFPLNEDKSAQLDFAFFGGLTNTFSQYEYQNSFSFPTPTTSSIPTQIDLSGQTLGGKVVLTKDFRDTRFRFITSYSRFGFNKVVNYDAYPTQLEEYLTTYDPSLDGLNVSIEVDFISNCKCLTFKFDMFNKIFGSESFSSGPGMYLGVNQNILKRLRDKPVSNI